MSVKADIELVREGLRTCEVDPSRRNARKLHNLLAELMVKHKDRLGLTDDEIVAYGGGVPKDPEG